MTCLSLYVHSDGICLLKAYVIEFLSMEQSQTPCLSIEGYGYVLINNFTLFKMQKNYKTSPTVKDCKNKNCKNIIGCRF